MAQFNLRSSPALIGVCAFIICIVLLGWAFGPGCADSEARHVHMLACGHAHATGRRDLEFIISVVAGAAAWMWARRG